MRLAAVAAVLGSMLAVEPGEVDASFLSVLAAGFVYAVASLLLAGRLKQQRYGLLYASLDLVWAYVLVVLTGDALSVARWTFALGPATAGFLLEPTAAGAVGATSLALYGSTILFSDRPSYLDKLVFQASIFLAWAGALAVLIAIILRTRERRVAALTAQLDAAEDRIRAQLAETLHAEVLQNIAVAYASLSTGSPSADWFERGRRALQEASWRTRQLIGVTHPFVAAERGLKETLEELGREAAAVGGFTYSAQIELTGATAHSDLIVAVARELLMNAARHSHARHVRLRLAGERHQIVLEVGDDGRGIDRSRVAGALQHAHIGLAAARARIEAAGGRLTIERPAAGALVRIVLPV